MHAIAGVAVAAACALASWPVARVATVWIALAAAPPLALMIAGAAFGLGLYPFSDAVVLLFSVLAGAVLARLLPSRFRPFLVLLAVLSLVDIAQNLVFAGPPPGPAPVAPEAQNPHFIWINFRVPLPTGHFTIGFGDLLLITALGEHLRRRGAAPGWAMLPGVIGLLLGDLLLALSPVQRPLLLDALLASLVPFLLGGFLLTESALRLSQRSAPA